MECAQIREEVSARADGEAVELADELLDLHLGTCDDCAGFRTALGVLAAVGSAAVAEPTDAGARSAAQLWHRRRQSRLVILRWAVALMGAAALANSLIEFIAHGGRAGHATHESLAFAIAISLALIVAGVRPAVASSYLPIVGTVVVLLGAAAVADVRSGSVGLADELPHIDLLAGFVALWLLAAEHGPTGAGPAAHWTRWSPTLRAGSRIRLVSARAVTARAVAGVGGVEGVGAGAGVAGWAHDRVRAGGWRRLGLSVGVLAALAVMLAPSAAIAHGAATSTVASTSTLISTSTVAQGTVVVSVDGVDQVGDQVGERAQAVESGDDEELAAEFAAEHPVLNAILTAARLVGYVGLAALIGGITLWMLGWNASDSGRILTRAGGVTLMVATLIQLRLKGAEMSGEGWGAGKDLTLVREVLETSYGRAELTLIFAVLVMLALLGWSASLNRRVRAVALGVLGVVVSATFAVSSHANSGDHQGLAIVTTTLHVLLMAAWGGGLLHLLVERLWGRAEAEPVLRRFSTLALASVAVLGLTGVVQGWRAVESVSALTQTDYGRMLLIKVFLVAGVVVVGAGARRLVNGRASALAFGRIVLIEAILVGLVLGVTAIMARTDPEQLVTAGRTLAAVIVQ